MFIYLSSMKKYKIADTYIPVYTQIAGHRAILWFRHTYTRILLKVVNLPTRFLAMQGFLIK
jgi:hypothetical protein